MQSPSPGPLGGELKLASVAVEQLYLGANGALSKGKLA
jgi:hypothetical protein